MTREISGIPIPVNLAMIAVSLGIVSIIAFGKHEPKPEGDQKRMALKGPRPDEQSLRTDIIHQDVMDALAHTLRYGRFTSAEVHRDTRVEDVLQGNECCIFHVSSTNPEHYLHHDNPEWAVVFDTDCDGDQQRGLTLLGPLIPRIQ